MRLRFFSAFLLALTLLIFQVTRVDAVAIAPTIFDLSADPGREIENTISIRNDEPLPKTFYFQLQKFVPKGDSGQQEFLPLTDVSGLPSWVFLSMPAVTLNAGQSIDVPFHVRIPADAIPGSYYAALFVSGQSSQPGSTTGAGLTARVGALLFLTVQGNVTERVRVTDFQRSSDGILDALPMGFTISFLNEGNVHSTPEGVLRVKNVLAGRPVDVQINAERGKVLPASERRFSVEWKRVEPSSSKGFLTNLREEWRNFAFGLYRADLSFSSNAVVGSAPSLYVWVFPWRLLLMVMVFLAITLFSIQHVRTWWLLRRSS